MAIKAAQNVVPFPARGGSGFNLLSSSKVKQIDRTNLHLIGWARELREARIHREPEFSFERTPEMLICMAMFKAMPVDQQARAMTTANEVYESAGDQPSHAASKIMAAIILTGER